MGCLVLSFSLLLLRVPREFSFQKTERFVRKQSPELSIYPGITISEEDQQTAQNTAAYPSGTEQPLNILRVMNWLVWLYWFGVVIFGLNFLVQLMILYYRVYTRPVINDGRFRIIELSGDKAPSSFGNNIFINPEKYDWETYNQILQHVCYFIQYYYY